MQETYTHFRDKDELLASSIHEILSPARSEPLPALSQSYERILCFGLSMFEHLQQHRRQHACGGGVRMDSRSRDILHEHLQSVLVELIRKDVEQCLHTRRKTSGRVPASVLIQYVASTFILVLNWWVDTDSSLTPKEVNDLFRALILPTLITTLEY